jgi:hypothetical protein
LGQGPCAHLARDAIGSAVHDQAEIDILADLLRDVTPLDHRLFTGVITAAMFGRFGALLFRALGGRFGDFRDWDEIEKWSTSSYRSVRAIRSARSTVRLA